MKEYRNYGGSHTALLLYFCYEQVVVCRIMKRINSLRG